METETKVAEKRRVVEITRRVPVGIEAALRVLKHAPGQVIGSDLASSWDAALIEETLGVDLPGGTRVARDVQMGLGPGFFEDDGAFVMPIWWEAAEHPHLFPTFDGGLEVHPAADAVELRLVGSYQPPLGPLGRFADAVIGNRIVMSSLDALLAGIAERLTVTA